MEKRLLKKEAIKAKKAAVLFSGGKDSCLALFKAKEQRYNIKYLLTILPASRDSYMYHKPLLPLLKEQAKQLGLPLIVQKSSKGKEAELRDLEILIKKIKSKIDALVIGGIASNYQGQRIKKIAEKLGLKVIAPLWSYSAEKLWHELLKNNFKVVITKIACEGLPKEILGKVITKKMLENLKILSQKYKFDTSFEGGDAETAVLSCPLFRKEIKIRTGIKSETPYRHFLVIQKISNWAGKAKDLNMS